MLTKPFRGGMFQVHQRPNEAQSRSKCATYLDLLQLVVINHSDHLDHFRWREHPADYRFGLIV